MFDDVRTLDLFKLDGRAALVTGAAAGLGRQFARGLAEAGAHVLCADIDREGAMAAADEICREGGEASGLVIDVSDQDSVQKAVEQVQAMGRTVEILVNNAGIVKEFERVHALSVESFDQVLNVNLRGAFLCMRAFLPAMVDAGKGTIINISSIVGLRGWIPDHFPQAHYAASKAGTEGLTRQAAVEYGKYNIRINAIAPGLHSGTNLGVSEVSKMQVKDPQRMLQEAAGLLTAHVPLGRWATAAELRGIVLLLASDAGAYISGQVFAHDGGYTIF